MKLNGNVMYAFKKISPGGHWINIPGLPAKKHQQMLFNRWKHMPARQSLLLMRLLVAGMKNTAARLFGLKPILISTSMVDGCPYCKLPPFLNIPVVIV